MTTQDEVAMRPIRVSASNAFKSEAWWKAARARLASFPASTHPIVERTELAVVVPYVDWIEFRCVAMTLPGWGPGLHPICGRFVDVAEH